MQFGATADREESRESEEAPVRNGTTPGTWRTTPGGEPRGYIQPHTLSELWFHTGTACNLACPFCLEGSKPGDGRLQRMTLSDAAPLMEEAVSLGVEQFSFTGGEPFVVKDFVRILEFALRRRPCLVLSNGTDSLIRRLSQIAPLADAPHAVTFRISIDWPDEHRHDAGRGAGNFRKAWQSMKALHELGFRVSLARQSEAGEDKEAADAAFRAWFQRYGLPSGTNIVSFPDFGLPHTQRAVPQITEQCMTTYHDETSRRRFMCAYSKMVVKLDGRVRVYACTLVDDDIDYDQGATLAQAMEHRVMLKHHRCYSCFAHGASCSES